MKNNFIFLSVLAVFFLSGTKLLAQDDSLLKLLNEDKPQKETVKNAFKSPRVINGHSIAFLRPGTMDFRILHRFGQLNLGYKNFFGLDQATMRMGFDFGLSENLMLGIGRSTNRKEVDAFIKYAPLVQATGKKSFPFTVALVSGITVDGMPWADPTQKNYFSSRLGYYFQTIVGRKISEGFTLQLSPTLVRKNLVQLAGNEKDVFSIGVGGRLRLTKRVSINGDYFYVLTPFASTFNQNPLSLGFDIETGGHVFQLHFSNTTGMNERAFITETFGNWSKGEVRFGFNLSRVFQIKKKNID
ncbi:MAG: hypothetical protein EPO57_07530 [Chitinophagaceae bacterium]|nr:MAG: hypothetical protein EPO57_07530 [Chitinophagaceae bacterium]